jgi:hypothetical protein
MLRKEKERVIRLLSHIYLIGISQAYRNYNGINGWIEQDGLLLIMRRHYILFLEGNHNWKF